jgi:prepilin signal peptidase PulO-like enzyme (type II secretory pathway)
VKRARFRIRIHEVYRPSRWRARSAQARSQVPARGEEDGGQPFLPCVTMRRKTADDEANEPADVGAGAASHLSKLDGTALQIVSSISVCQLNRETSGFYLYRSRKGPGMTEENGSRLHGPSDRRPAAAARQRRPWPLELVVGLNYLTCIIALFYSISYLIAGVQNRYAIGIVFAVVPLVCAAGGLIVNMALSFGANWARITMSVFLVLLLLLDFVALVIGLNPHKVGETLGSMFIAAAFLVILNLGSTKRFCTAR